MSDAYVAEWLLLLVVGLTPSGHTFLPPVADTWVRVQEELWGRVCGRRWIHVDL